jgi:hypothetical protein
LANQLFETAHLILVIDTKDSSLGSHTNKKMWTVPPKADGTAGDLANAVSYPFTAIAGLNGDSAAQSDPILLIKGAWRYWAESDNPAGLHCVSPPFFALADGRGVVRQ